MWLKVTRKALAGSQVSSSTQELRGLGA